jgi:hypothetical protein
MTGVLKEELARLVQSERSYRAEIKKLPKGSFQKKRIHGKAYLYLAYRGGEKILSKYVGNLSDEKIQKLQADLKQRKKYEVMLKEVRLNIKKIRKMIGGKRQPV